MKISVNTIQALNQRYGCADDIAAQGIDDLVRKIGAQLGAIEEVVDVGSKYAGVIIVKVVSCLSHPNADKLKVCKIDDGGKAEDLERDESGYVQVVCGAPNVREGLMVAWLPPGSTVPESVGKEPFVLGGRELRGVISNGMLASPKELALGDSHDGILEIDEAVVPGSDFAEHFNLTGDYVLDIENKMFTHRPDGFGFLGVARELAGIQAMPFKSPEWYRTDVAVPTVEAGVLPLEVRNELPELVPRFTAIVMRDVQVKPSPLGIQIELIKVGLRPINNIVDLTNFFMLETGQPLHAYDYDKVKALDGGDKATIVVRQPRPGEKIQLLNGKELEPRAEAIMIATENALIGVGGVMGGADTEVDEHTKNIIIEVANFDMYSIRRTSMAHGLFTDAVTRFNKGQSPLQTRTVLAKMVNDVQRLADGKVASDLIDIINLPSEVLEHNSVHTPVKVSVEFINARLGLQLSAEQMTTLLTNVEFRVGVSGDELMVMAPFWRTDIEIPEDIVEEIGRLYGFDRLPLVLPSRPMLPVAKNASFELKQQIRDALSRAGANEVLTYSFVHGNLLQKVGQTPEQAYQLSNALSPDLQYYRQSLTPSLLERIHPNIKAGHDRFALFEIGKAHIKGQVEDTADGLPIEFERLALVFAADPKAAKSYEGAAYYQAKKYLEVVLDKFNLTNRVIIEDLQSDSYNEATQTKVSFYEPGRTAVVRLGDVVLGEIGEYKASVRKAMKLPEYTAGFELDLNALKAAGNDGSVYVPLSRYPKVEQDLCLRVPVAVSYAQVHDLFKVELDKLLTGDALGVVSPVDIYQRQGETDYKQVTLRLSIVSYEKTLRDVEVATILQQIAQAAAAAISAEVV